MNLFRYLTINFETYYNRLIVIIIKQIIRFIKDDPQQFSLKNLFMGFHQVVYVFFMLLGLYTILLVIFVVFSNSIENGTVSVFIQMAYEHILFILRKDSITLIKHLAFFLSALIVVPSFFVLVLIYFVKQTCDTIYKKLCILYYSFFCDKSQDSFNYKVEGFLNMFTESLRYLIVGFLLLTVNHCFGLEDFFRLNYFKFDLATFNALLVGTVVYGFYNHPKESVKIVNFVEGGFRYALNETCYFLLGFKFKPFDGGGGSGAGGFGGGQMLVGMPLFKNKLKPIAELRPGQSSSTIKNPPTVMIKLSDTNIIEASCRSLVIYSPPFYPNKWWESSQNCMVIEESQAYQVYTQQGNLVEFLPETERKLFYKELSPYARRFVTFDSYLAMEIVIPLIDSTKCLTINEQFEGFSDYRKLQHLVDLGNSHSLFNMSRLKYQNSIGQVEWGKHSRHTREVEAELFTTAINAQMADLQKLANGAKIVMPSMRKRRSDEMDKYSYDPADKYYGVNYRNMSWYEYFNSNHKFDMFSKLIYQKTGFYPTFRVFDYQKGTTFTEGVPRILLVDELPPISRYNLELCRASTKQSLIDVTLKAKHMTWLTFVKQNEFSSTEIRVSMAESMGEQL